MGGLTRRLLVGSAFGVLVYVLAVLAGEAGAVAGVLAGFDRTMLLWALLASAGNYALRFAKWEICLHALAVRRRAPQLGIGRSLWIYLSGLSMSITPGKVGEVLRSAILRAACGVPFRTTAPAVVADRLSDVLALVLLSLLGLGRHARVPSVGLAVTAGCLVLVWLLGSPRRLHAVLHRLARVRRLRGAVERADLLVEASVRVLAPRVLLFLVALSVLGWGLECLGFAAILAGFGAPAPSLGDAAFVWAFATLVGAVTFLPGGLGATEASLGVLVLQTVPAASKATAVGVTLLSRAATLWFGELVGLIALAVLFRDPRLRRGVRGGPAAVSGDEGGTAEPSSGGA